MYLYLKSLFFQQANTNINTFSKNSSNTNIGAANFTHEWPKANFTHETKRTLHTILRCELNKRF
jgi:hypothetical protein